MGILLLSQRKKTSVNPVVQSLNLVYMPSSTTSENEEPPILTDPSGVRIAFLSVQSFEEEERTSRVPRLVE
jgi:hypothetical protein